VTTTPAESDPFLELLTDALRAGPGSPQWADAVAKLRDGGVQGADEYKLILRAREDIELGRDFRKVSAGPGFTRKVLDAVEREGRRRQGLPTATIVAILAGLVILGVIVTVIVIMSRGGGGTTGAGQAAIERLESASLPVSVASGSLPGALDGFQASSTEASGVTRGRAITTRPLDAGVPAVIECEFTVPPAGDRHLVQLFIADSPDAASDLSLSYSEGRVSVALPGPAASPPEAATLGTPGQPLKAAIRFDRETAIIEAGGRRLFAGPHGLGGAPRYAGLRFVQPAGDPGRPLEVRSISVARAAEGAR
jgi:hypothetical protein